MGLYINTADKPAWLRANTRQRLGAAEARAYTFPKNLIPVAYVDNGAFDALAILYNKTEAKRFVDGRPDATLCLVERSSVKEWLP